MQKNAKQRKKRRRIGVGKDKMLLIKDGIASKMQPKKRNITARSRTLMFDVGRKQQEMIFFQNIGVRAFFQVHFSRKNGDDFIGIDGTARVDPLSARYKFSAGFEKKRVRFVRYTLKHVGYSHFSIGFCC